MGSFILMIMMHSLKEGRVSFPIHVRDLIHRHSTCMGEEMREREGVDILLSS